MLNKIDSAMFCYQCEQTARGTGCMLVGACGKDSTVAGLQDLLVYQIEGLAYYGMRARAAGCPVRPEIDRFVIDALFATLTNVNFVQGFFIDLLRQSQAFKAELRALAGSAGGSPAPLAALYQLPETDAAILRDAERVNIRPYAVSDIDMQSLKDTLLFGLKGMAAYAYHAWVLNYRDPAVTNFLYRGLSAMLDDSLSLTDMVDLLMAFGQVNLRCMELLDAANTETYGHPEPSPVRITRRKGPFIVVSGHDLYDLKLLLEQSAGKGVNIYTHGEMLPANAYPELKKYPHLAGNYGGAWQEQQVEFDQLPGAILMTTNCLIEPDESYADRLFTTGLVGWEGIAHIAETAGANGASPQKDFSAVINKALELGGWSADEPEKTILTGFGRNATLSHAGEIVSAVKSGQINHFFLIGGCDGARPGRNYYTEFAEATPADSVILTLACGKYRFNTLDFGTVAGLPRLLDVGQCNDAYSAIRIALALSEAFACGVNDLPLTLVLSWFEQKAVCILLTLLSLGIQNIYIGPTLPAFLSPNVLNLLVEKFNLHPVSTPQEDLAAMLA